MPAEHIIKSYDEELDKLNKIIVEMGGLAESQLAAAIEAVSRRDSELAARVIQDDDKVDQLERDLDNLAIRLLALRQFELRKGFKTWIYDLRYTSMAFKKVCNT